MKRTIILLLFVVVSCTASAQHYKYIDSSKVMDLKSYQQQIKADPDIRLVEINKYIPGIVLDIRYATANNFMHRKMTCTATEATCSSVAGLMMLAVLLTVVRILGIVPSR